MQLNLHSDSKLAKMKRGQKWYTPIHCYTISYRDHKVKWLTICLKLK